MTAPSRPIACTLTSHELGNQRERWLRVGAQALLDRVETEDGLQLSFRAEPGVETELARLVDVERECCAWADWLLEQDAGRVTVHARSTGEGVGALHNMFTALA